MKTILLVEDTEELRVLMTNALTKSGFKVIAATNGMEALKIFKAFPEIEAVVTDLEMSVMDGIQLIKEIRKIDTGTPIIMWSGSVDPQIYGISFFSKEVGSKPVSKMLKILLFSSSEEAA